MISHLFLRVAHQWFLSKISKNICVCNHRILRRQIKSNNFCRRDTKSLETPRNTTSSKSMQRSWPDLEIRHSNSSKTKVSTKKTESERFLSYRGISPPPQHLSITTMTPMGLSKLQSPDSRPKLKKISIKLRRNTRTLTRLTLKWFYQKRQIGLKWSNTRTNYTSKVKRAPTSTCRRIWRKSEANETSSCLTRTKTSGLTGKAKLKSSWHAQSNGKQSS